MKRNSKERI